MSLSVMDQVQGTISVVRDFGTIEVPAGAVIKFTEALWGFPDRTDYVLLPAARRGMYWLLSVGDPPATFVLADPFVVSPEYVVDVSDTDKAQLQIEHDADALALVMVSLPGTSSEPVTANFRAPIVFNLRARIAAQIVGRDESYALRAPVDLSIFPLVDGGVTLGSEPATSSD
jgi:flagellar assembly factor FliW